MNREILDLLRQQDSMSVADFVRELQVTATAVRHQLHPLLAEGMVEKSTVRGARGRPRHAYRLTEKGQRTAGSNFADLAQVLWKELRSVAAPEVRRGLLQRVASRLADHYSPQIRGANRAERMQEVVDLFESRDIPLRVAANEVGQLPVLEALSCPYPDLAEQDRTVCSMERLMFSELLGTPLRLTHCRLDGDNCCTFALQVAEETPNA